MLFLQPLSSGSINFVVSWSSCVLVCCVLLTDRLSSRATAWTESSRSWVLLAAFPTFSSSQLISFTSSLVFCISVCMSHSAGTRIESIASLMAASRPRCCSCRAGLIPLAIAASSSSLEMAVSLKFFFTGDCSFSFFRVSLVMKYSWCDRCQSIRCIWSDYWKKWLC